MNLARLLEYIYKLKDDKRKLRKENAELKKENAELKKLVGK